VGGDHSEVSVVVLAAGDGRRLKSEFPKVLHPAAGRPLLAHVLAALEPLPLEQRIVVASPRRDEVERSMAACGFGGDLEFVVQDAPRGTADAVRIGADSLDASCRTVLVVPGDAPLVEADTLFRVLDVHRTSSAAATVLTATVHDPSGYGRVVRGPDGVIERIVEERDADPDLRRIHEINGGVFAFEVDLLVPMLSKIDRENSQGEYYLSDVIGLFYGEDERVAAVETDAEEVSGVNSRSQLAYVSGLLRHRVCERWMAEGVSIVDPRTTYIDSTVVIERDATIYPFTFLEGNTQIGTKAEVGPQARLVDSEVGSEATVSFAVVKESRIGPQASVGPFASLRPGTVLGKGAHLGTFVEAKQVVMGEDSKANHLAYLGDAEIGRRVNVGAGTITCNWDGSEKHETVIEDDAYIGSDTMLVAPAHIGKRAATGAGAVVKGDVPDDALAVGVPARIIEGKGDRMQRKAGPEEPKE
jgi:bifunctional UDP-N-acetylglucosamine pyrophosphorylase / glucosamine-1-phosphate N-acetyltransferase